jgi:phage-related holin
MKTAMKFFSSLETYLYGLLGMLSAFIMPIVPFLALCGLLILLDTITGIRAAMRRGEKPNSRKASRIIDKTLVYGSSVLACHGVEVVLKLPETVTYFAVGAIAFTELMSVLENTRVVTGTNIGEIVKNMLPGMKTRKAEKPVEDEEDEIEK